MFSYGRVAREKTYGPYTLALPGRKLFIIIVIIYFPITTIVVANFFIDIIIAGCGFQKVRSAACGNLIVETKCHIPKSISTEAKEALTEYSNAIGTGTQNSEGSIAGFFKKFLG